MTIKEAIAELGVVDKDANLPNLKKVYRKLVGKWHPDRNKSPGALAKTQRINAAYTLLVDVLKHPEKYAPPPEPVVVVQYQEWYGSVTFTGATATDSYSTGFSFGFRV